MALSPGQRLAAPLDESGLIAGDLACIGCGYNLRMQPADGRCPECARACDVSLSGHWLRSAPPDWLWQATTGVSLMAAAGSALPLVLISGLFTGAACVLAAVIPTLALLAIGIFLAAAPEPGRDGRQGTTVFASLARYALCLWPAPMLVLLDRAVTFSHGWREAFFQVLLILSVFLGGAGLTAGVSGILAHVSGLLVRVPQIALARFVRFLATCAAAIGLIWTCGFLLLIFVVQPVIFGAATATMAPTSQVASTSAVVVGPPAAATAPIARAPLFPVWYMGLSLMMAVTSLLLLALLVAFPVVTILIARTLRRVQRQAANAPTA